jgi:hypothetical protein
MPDPAYTRYTSQPAYLRSIKDGSRISVRTQEERATLWYGPSRCPPDHPKTAPSVSASATLDGLFARLPSLIHPSAIINPCKALFVKPIPCRGPRLPAQMQAVGCGDLLRRHGRRSTPASALCLSRSHQHSHSSSSVSFTCVVFVEKLWVFQQ